MLAVMWAMALCAVMAGCHDPCHGAAQYPDQVCEPLRGRVCLCTCRIGTRPEVMYVDTGPCTGVETLWRDDACGFRPRSPVCQP